MIKKNLNPNPNAKNIQTVLHSYYFNMSVPNQAQSYKELRSRLKAQGLACFAALSNPMRDKRGNSGYYHPALDGKIITLDTDYLFANQWNTAPIEGYSESGLRVFDWAENVYPNKDIKAGHYLEQTQEMRDVRDYTAKCGYCGKYDRVEAFEFCPHCLDSNYLTENSLHLTRMCPVSMKAERPQLTEAEKVILLPKFREAQMHGRYERQRAYFTDTVEKVKNETEERIFNLRTERDGKLWFLKHGLLIENLIYYPHTQTFCLGWLTPLTAEEARKWEIALGIRNKTGASLLSESERQASGFWFNLEIKTDGEKIVHPVTK